MLLLLLVPFAFFVVVVVVSGVCRLAKLLNISHRLTRQAKRPREVPAQQRERERVEEGRVPKPVKHCDTLPSAPLTAVLPDLAIYKSTNFQLVDTLMKKAGEEGEGEGGEAAANKKKQRP